MKICDKHFAELRAAIELRGLNKFLVTDGNEAASRIAREMSTGQTTVDTFDPLIYAHTVLFADALRTAGFVLMTPDPKGAHRCPICFLLAGCPCKEIEPGQCDFETWIDGAADAALREAVALNLVGAA